MKKIFLLFAAVSLIFACDPVQEDIKIGGNITADELKAMSSVSVDKADNGQNGNVITCTTSAPVNAMWSIGGKEFTSNYATKKMKLGEYTVTLTGLCADGTIVKADFPVKCEVVTDPLNRYYIYGEDPTAQPPFDAPNWDSNYMRFSDNEGKKFPFLSDEIYWGFKTLVFDMGAGTDAEIKVMSGWWSSVNCDNVFFKEGLNELPLTEDIAKVCARGNNGKGQDLTLMVVNGFANFKTVYYEE